MESAFIPTTATLSHLRDDAVYEEEMPYEIWADNVPTDVPRTNVKLNIVPDCPLTDIRTLIKQEKPALETAGFQWLYQAFPYHTGLHSADYVDYPRQKQLDTLERYLDVMSEFLREELGCVKVVCWDWRVRVSKMTKPRLTPNIYSLKQEVGKDVRSVKINSSHIIHADGSPAWIQKVVSRVATDEEVRWAESDPLVCCDTRTVSDSDLDVVQKVMDNTVEESMYLKRRTEHQWYWMSNQTRDDVLVMTVWDSTTPSTKSTAVPHCAMVLPKHPPNAKPRESIELRFVVWNAE